MALALRNPQSAIVNSDDWLTLDAAAELTGLSLRRWQQIASRAFHSGLARKTASATSAGKPVWYVHRTLDPKLTRFPDRDCRGDRVRQSLLSKYPAAHVALAYAKAHWLKVWRERCERPRPAGQTDGDLAHGVAAEAKEASSHPSFRVSGRSLQLWHQQFNAPGPDGQIMGVEALVPKYRNPQSAIRNPQSRSADAVAFFYSLYHSQNRLSATLCHQATIAEARRQGWTWPASYTSTTRWLRRQDDLVETCLQRDGGRAYSHKFMPHLETDWDAIQPGEMYVCDHTQCDFWVQYRDKQIRPWLTAVQDMRTRSIVGWHLGPAPHSEAIATSFRMAFRDWAIPSHMRIDNGKDFCSQWLTGLTKSEVRAMRRELGSRWKQVLREKRDSAVDSDPRWLGLVHELGIELIYAIPYAAWSKGTIERFFGRFHDQCGKTFVTYCGNSPMTRPECLGQIRQGVGSAVRTKTGDRLTVVDDSDVPTIDQARERIADYIDTYHRSEHRGDGMQRRTPLQVWSTASNLRKADPEALAFLCSIRGEYKVGGNGVSVTVAGRRFSYGARCPALRRFAGRKVLVGVDSEHPTEAFAFEVGTRRLIARLEPNERIHPCATTDDVREAVAEIQRDRKGMRSAQRTAARRTRTAAERINRHVRDKAAELRATGTDDVNAANITPVRTGFEVPSNGDRTTASAALPGTDRKPRDLSVAKAALGFGRVLGQKPPARRRRVSDDVLRGPAMIATAAVEDGGEQDNESGTDAGHSSSTELLRLIGGRPRGERTGH